MHHNTKRNRSPTKAKPLVIARPIVFNNVDKITSKYANNTANNLDGNIANNSTVKHTHSGIAHSNGTSSSTLTATVSRVIPQSKPHTSLSANNPMQSAKQETNKISGSGHSESKAVLKFEPNSFIKQNATRNSYDICMIKKFIGKKILIPVKGLLLTPKVKEDAKSVKHALLSQTNQKNITMHAICINGTMHIVSGYSSYIAISSISYKDIEANTYLQNTEIKLVLLPKITNANLKILLDYLA